MPGKSVGTQISADEIGKLRELLKGLDLGHFHPKAEWFERKSNERSLTIPQTLAVADWNYSLVIWSGGERVAFHLPLRIVREHVPEADRGVYAKMDDIAVFMMELQDKYLESEKTHPADERAMKQLLSEMSEISAESLPRRP